MKFFIYRQSKSAMQSGKGNTKKWIMLLVEDQNNRMITSPMNWIGSNDTNSQLKFIFNSKIAAIEFANSKNYDYEIIENRESLVKPKSYASNFL